MILYHSVEEAKDTQARSYDGHSQIGCWRSDKKMAYTGNFKKERRITMRPNNWDELPLVLHASHIRGILGLSKSKTYALMHSSDFPVIFFGKRMVVTKESFTHWLEQRNKPSIERRAII